METRASYLLVGSFVLAIMAGAVVFVLWITGAETEKTVLYHMKFQGSVTGLQIGSQVRFRGIPVGEVSTISIVEDEDDPSKPIAIEVAVDIREDTPIRQGTQAILEVQGITGVSFVQLTSEGDPGKRLAPSTKKKKVYIPTKRSSIEKIFKNFPELLAELTALASQGRKLLSDDNLEKIDRTFTNIEKVTGNLAEESEDLNAILKEGREIIGVAKPALENISDAAEEFSKTAGDIGTAVNAFEDAAREVEVLIKTNQQPVADFMATGLYDISQFFIEARQLVTALSRITKKLESDPARFLFGDQSQGYTAQ